jgi:hypothetical protein
MLDRSARKFDAYTALATGNHALILSNQAMGADNQKLFKEHIKHDEEVRARMKVMETMLDALSKRGQGR